MREITLGARLAALPIELVRLQRALADAGPMGADELDARLDEITMMKFRVGTLQEAHMLSMRLQGSKRREAQLLRQNKAQPMRLAREYQT